MASIGAEKEESARDGDSTALKWDDYARSFSGDGVAPILPEYAMYIPLVGCPRSPQL